jgi:hypothetical protein
MGANDPQEWPSGRRVCKASNLPSRANDARAKNLPAFRAMVRSQPSLQRLQLVPYNQTENWIQQDEAQRREKQYKPGAHIATPPNDEYERPEPAASDARVAADLKGWLRSAPCSGWPLLALLFSHEGAVSQRMVPVEMVKDGNEPPSPGSVAEASLGVPQQKPALEISLVLL